MAIRVKRRPTQQIIEQEVPKVSSVKQITSLGGTGLQATQHYDTVQKKQLAESNILNLTDVTKNYSVISNGLSIPETHSSELSWPIFQKKSSKGLGYLRNKGERIEINPKYWDKIEDLTNWDYDFKDLDKDGIKETATRIPEDIVDPVELEQMLTDANFSSKEIANTFDFETVDEFNQWKLGDHPTKENPIANYEGDAINTWTDPGRKYKVHKVYGDAVGEEILDIDKGIKVQDEMFTRWGTTSSNPISGDTDMQIQWLEDNPGITEMIKKTEGIKLEAHKGTEILKSMHIDEKLRKRPTILDRIFDPTDGIVNKEGNVNLDTIEKFRKTTHERITEGKVPYKTALDSSDIELYNTDLENYGIDVQGETAFKSEEMITPDIPGKFGEKVYSTYKKATDWKYKPSGIPGSNVADGATINKAVQYKPVTGGETIAKVSSGPFVDPNMNSNVLKGGEKYMTLQNGANVPLGAESLAAATGAETGFVKGAMQSQYGAPFAASKAAAAAGATAAESAAAWAAAMTPAGWAMMAVGVLSALDELFD